MAEDCVILLSSDESDAFVTPYKEAPTALKAASQRYEFDDDDDDDFLGRRLQSRMSTLTATAAGQTVAAATHNGASRVEETGAWNGSGSILEQPATSCLPARNVDVFVIDDTPIQSSSNSAKSGNAGAAGNNDATAASGCPGSSLDLFSSPFSSLATAQQNPINGRPPVTVGENLQPAASDSFTPNVRSSRAFAMPFDDDDFEVDEARPSKRPRLSPAPRTATFSTPFQNSSRLSLARRIPSNDKSPTRQPSRSTFTMDDSDDEIRGSPVSKSAFPAPKPTSQNGRAANSRAECIDLLSSSDAEASRAPAVKAAYEADAEFVDIDDLLINSPPLQKAHDPPVASRPRREPSAEIMLLSSSPQGPLARSASDSAAQHTAASGRALAQALPRPQAYGSLKRSFSEGHALAFDDDDDDEDLGIWGNGPNDVDDLLAAWRKRPPTETRVQAKPGGKNSSTASRRRSSFDLTANRSLAAGERARSGSSTNKAAPALSEADKEARRRERETAREEKKKKKEAEKRKRQLEKEVEKERRKINADMAKEKKAYERAEAAAFNNANRSRVDKSVAAPEMIVRLPLTFPQATKEITEGLLGEIRANSEMWKSPFLDNVIAWRRKVTADYRADLGHWVPVEERVEDENFVMAVFRAEDLVKLIVAAQDPEIKQEMSGFDLEGHLKAMKRTFARHTIIYLVEGLHAWRSKNRTIRKRQFANAVRSIGGNTSSSARTIATTPARAAAAAALNRSGQSGQLDEPAAAPAASRPSNRLGRRGQQRPPQHLDETLVDDAMLELQMGFDDSDDDDNYNDGGASGQEGPKRKIMVHETQSSLDTARWIKIFTEQIATGRYRRLKEELYAASASFCMDSGQITTGDGSSETYVLMLQQIARVTEPVAMGVAARYETLPKLVRGFRDEGPLALEGCLKSRNRNGALSDRTVGQALSRRIYKVVMGTDEASTDI